MSHPTIITLPSRRFFSAFHHYVTSSNTSAHTIPRTSSVSPRYQQHPPQNNIPSPSRAFASTTSTPSSPPPSSPVARTHYSLFPKTVPDGPPPKGAFDISSSQLKKEFLQLQALAHPDRHYGADKQKAEGTSALINEAYKTLQDPLRRAQYLLSLRGIDIAEDERAKTDDMELLEEVMEVRSLIEGAEEERELEETRQRNEKRMEESVKVLDDAFKRDNLEEAKAEAVRLRYWTNIKESLDSWEKGKPVVLIH
ncbi:MAG: hypothetical protein Q9217_001695 [Psora testacea]